MVFLIREENHNRKNGYTIRCIRFSNEEVAPDRGRFLVRIRTRNRPLSGLSGRSGFLLELVAAADTGDVAFAGTALHAQEDFTVRALEVLIVLAVLEALCELGALQFPVGGQVDVLPVFFNTLGVVTRKHTEDSCDVEGETDKGEQADAGEAAQKRSHKTGKKGEHTEIVGAMTTLHENG